MSDRHDPHVPHEHDEDPVSRGDLEDVGGHPMKDQGTQAPTTPVADIDLIETATSAPRTLYGDAWNRLRRNKLAIAGLVWIIIMSTAVITADLWVPAFFADPYTPAYGTLEPPTCRASLRD